MTTPYNKANDEAIIKVKNLRKSFGDNEVLKGIDYEIHRGEKIVVIGPSGSGKSTFLRCLNLLEQPTDGEIYFEDKCITDKKCDINEVRRHMGMVFPQYNVLQNLTLAPSLLKMGTKEELEAQARQIIKKVGLEEKVDFYPSQLSGGQKQRVAIARALMLNPDILCFDEPTSALDPELTGEVLRVIKSLKDTGSTMIVVTHEMGFARQVASKVLFIDDGIIKEEAEPEEFFTNPKDARLQDFLSKVL